MLSRLEDIHFGGRPISRVENFPLDYFKKNLDRIDWANARFSLPLSFQVEFMPESERLAVEVEEEEKYEPEDEDENWSSLIVYGLDIPSCYSGVLTQKEFQEIMKQKGRYNIFQNNNIPYEWFEPYFSGFTEHEWSCYSVFRSLTEEQFDRYGRGEDGEPICNVPLSRIPYQVENFETIFSHPDLTAEFIQAHLEDALANYQQIFWSKVGYPFALEHYLQLEDPDPDLLIKPEDLDKHPRLINAETFTRDDLPMWFSYKYRELIGDKFNSRPSRRIVSWLKEHRPKIHASWRKRLERQITDFRFFRGNMRRDIDTELIQEEKAFTSSMKKALTLFF